MLARGCAKKMGDVECERCGGGGKRETAGRCFGCQIQDRQLIYKTGAKFHAVVFFVKLRTWRESLNKNIENLDESFQCYFSVFHLSNPVSDCTPKPLSDSSVRWKAFCVYIYLINYLLASTCNFMHAFHRSNCGCKNKRYCCIN